MTTPEQPGGTQVRVSTDPHVLVSISGPTEAAVLRRAADWLDTLDGAVLIVASNWRGDVGAPDNEDTPFYRMDLTVDMSIAVREDRWPRDWFPGQG
jgi:hypothetical protein